MKNVTVSPHKPYLCSIYDGKNTKPYTGDDIAKRFLDDLPNHSLTYFHNLKYDVCFFIDEPYWTTHVIKSGGTILQAVMKQPKTIRYWNKETHSYKTKDIIKRLTFRDSYSLIPAPLSRLANIFNLIVHKEIMLYKLYTAANINRKMIPFNEFKDQYRDEHIDDKTEAELEQDYSQLLINAKEAEYYDETTHD
ncbi:hypothetical protein M9Y10_007459 [Tritrichomonas musculus]|uniref:DNA-directed DNA polymerase n=1 Tax=Tritrichomonas musculus TaxID=1915356 RepID=A0ABR2J1L5_9EUKA